MPGALTLLLRQLASVWKNFGINQKVSIVLALLATLAAIFFVLYWSARPDFRLLYAGMTLEDAAHARERLEDERIKVQLRDHGRALYVPSADVYRGRLLLAAAGLPQDTATGFELFEQPKFGLTEFAQQVNYQRALQGELERTIVAMDGIQAARVMLVMPRERLFASERDSDASVSIMLTLHRGVRMAPHQVNSIRQLVMMAAPGLGTGRVTITDQQGQLLSDGSQTQDSALGATSRQLDLQRTVEEELARKAQDMLDRAIGPDQAIVRVSAEVDFRRTERQNETFDADGRVIIRETISSENVSEPFPSVARDMAQVNVGDPGNVTFEHAMGQRRREDVDTEYRIPSGRETVVDQGGRITRLSVSVSVARGEQPRDAEALQRIERMVRSAVGLVDTPQRRDTLEVLEMEFSAHPQPLAVSPWMALDRLPFSPMVAGRFLLGAILLFLMYRFSRKTLRQLGVEREAVGTPISMLAGEGAPLGQLHPAESPVEGTDVESEIDDVERLAEQNPGTIANWIDQTVRNNA